MLNFHTSILEMHSANNFSMKEKTPVTKINIRGNIETKEFPSKIGKILGIILPKESCSTSKNEHITSRHTSALLLLVISFCFNDLNHHYLFLLIYHFHHVHLLFHLLNVKVQWSLGELDYDYDDMHGPGECFPHCSSY